MLSFVIQSVGNAVYHGISISALIVSIHMMKVFDKVEGSSLL
jgi:hypothetical protein